MAVGSLTEALDAIAAGAVDLVVGDWDADAVAALRDAIAPRALVERTALPPGAEIDDARAALARPLFTAWLGQVDGSGAAGRATTWAPGRDEAPPVPARRLSAEWEDAAWREGAPEQGLGRLDPDLAGILERSLADTPAAGGRDRAPLPRPRPGGRGDRRGWPTLRARRCGEIVTYVINRNINYTNQCYFRCGFCGFSRGPKSLNLRGDPYILNVHEVATARSRPGSGAPPRSACRAASTPTSPATSTVGVLRVHQGAPARDARPRLQRRSRSGRAPTPLGVSRCASSSTRLPGTPASATLPGTAAEILDDAVRPATCARTRCAHLRVGRGDITAHELGLRATT